MPGQRGHGPILSIRGCNTDELERAAEDLEKATNELVKRAEELAKRSEELNRQLLRLAEALTRPVPIKPRETPPELAKPAEPKGASQPTDSSGILAEVKELLDGPEGGPGLAWQDPRD
jgi:chromosome segregation ATPase